MIQKHWNLLAINESLKNIYNCQPITVFTRNTNLKELIESNKIEKNKVNKRQIQKLKPEKCSPCLKKLSLCCKSIKNHTNVKKVGHTPQNFCLAFIDELEKQIFVEVGQ